MCLVSTPFCSQISNLLAPWAVRRWTLRTPSYLVSRRITIIMLQSIPLIFFSINAITSTSALASFVQSSTASRTLGTSPHLVSRRNSVVLDAQANSSYENEVNGDAVNLIDHDAKSELPYVSYYLNFSPCFTSNHRFNSAYIFLQNCSHGKSMYLRHPKTKKRGRLHHQPSRRHSYHSLHHQNWYECTQPIGRNRTNPKERGKLSDVLKGHTTMALIQGRIFWMPLK